MAEVPLLIDTDPPSAFVAGGPRDQGIISKQTLGGVIQEARDLSSKIATDDETKDNPLAPIVASLAEQVGLLAGELYQVAHGVQTGRISFLPPEQ